MRRNLWIATSLFALLFVPLAMGGGPKSKGNGNNRGAKSFHALGCLQCSIIRLCWYCVSNAGSSGGTTCQAACDFCNLGPVCVDKGPGGFGCSPGFSLPEETPSVRTLRLSDDTVRGIAASHPRFGLALAILNKTGFNGGSTLHLTPIDVTEKHIEAYLNPKSASVGFLRKRDKQAQRVNGLIEQGVVAPVVYRIVVENADSTNPVLSLRVISSASVDPSYSSLEVKFFFLSEATAATKAENPVKTEWRLY